MSYTDHIFDYIIAGSGAAGLILAYRMSDDPFFKGKSVLLIDKEEKNSDDRTWCYWEKGAGEWDHLTSKIWDKIYFGSPTYSDEISLGTYRYKMIRSSKFYHFLLNRIQQNSLFTLLKAEVINIENDENQVKVETSAGCVKCRKLFTSIADIDILTKQTKYHYLKQHFIGWYISTEEKVFNPEVPVFMDFDIQQKGNTRFMYVLPLSENKALVEYTLFSESLLNVAEYEAAIGNYLNQKRITNYAIDEIEMGDIPMTCFPFEDKNSKNVMYIGSAGGWTKPSTGYTFARTTSISKKLINFLKRESDFTKFSTKNRYWYYDLVMLDVLYLNNEKGSEIFASIFKNNTIEEIFRFLDENGTWLNDMKIMLKTKPAGNFSKSALKQIFTLFQ